MKCLKCNALIKKVITKKSEFVYHSTAICECGQTETYAGATWLDSVSILEQSLSFLNNYKSGLKWAKKESDKKDGHK
jgi:hypothetical protein